MHISCNIEPNDIKVGAFR